MIVVNARLLDIFANDHAPVRKSLATWKRSTKEATWKKKQDVLISFPNAKMLKNNKVRFEILHNRYRLIAELFYESGLVEVRFIGTHAEYDKINPSTV